MMSSSVIPENIPRDTRIFGVYPSVRLSICNVWLNERKCSANRAEKC